MIVGASAPLGGEAGRSIGLEGSQKSPELPLTDAEALSSCTLGHPFSRNQADNFSPM
jgi:hypothetical protein